MKVEHFTQTPAELQEAPGVAVRWVINKDDGAPNFVMRVIEVQPGSATPYHQHTWEHEVFCLTGEGVVRSEEREFPIAHGSIVFVAPNEQHQFVNRGDTVLSFICVIPNLT